MRKSGGGGSFGEFLVGVFMVAVLGLLFYFTVVISGKDLLSGNRSVFTEVTFADVGGLKVRDSVIVRGMVVGSVSSMQIERDHVRVRLSLHPDVTFREGYQIDVRATSLLGGNNLVIEEGKGTALPPDTPLIGQAPSNWMRDLGEVVSNLREATVCVSVFGHEGERGTVLRQLAGKAKELQALINRDLTLKYTPRLRFDLDGSVEKGDRVLNVLNRLAESEAGDQTVDDGADC